MPETRSDFNALTAASGCPKPEIPTISNKIGTNPSSNGHSLLSFISAINAAAARQPSCTTPGHPRYGPHSPAQAPDSRLDRRGRAVLAKDGLHMAQKRRQLAGPFGGHLGEPVFRRLNSFDAEADGAWVEPGVWAWALRPSGRARPWRALTSRESVLAATFLAGAFFAGGCFAGVFLAGAFSAATFSASTFWAGVFCARGAATAAAGLAPWLPPLPPPSRRPPS